MERETIKDQEFPSYFLKNNSSIFCDNGIKRIISSRHEINIINFKDSKSYPKDKVLNASHLYHLMTDPSLIPVRFSIDLERYFKYDERIKILFLGTLFHFNGYQGDTNTIPELAYWKSLEIDQDTNQIFEGHVFAGLEENTYVAVFCV